MACFTFEWFRNFLIFLVIMFAVAAVVQIIVPKLLSLAGVSPDGGATLAILRIFVWAMVAVAVIVFVFNVMECIFGGGPSLGSFGNFGRIR